MLPDPLHPAVVHFPIALAALVPLLAVLAIVAIGRRFLPPRSWWLIVVLQALLVGSAWFATETGEDQEERVERVVAEGLIEEHEQAAERFLWVAAIGLALIALGLLPAGRGSAGRWLGTAASIAALAAAIPVGDLGGKLVYKHGAASAYVERASLRGADPGHDNGDEHGDD